MKISESIEKLREILNEEGDLELYTHEAEYGITEIIGFSVNGEYVYANHH